MLDKTSNQQAKFVGGENDARLVLNETRSQVRKINEKRGNVQNSIQILKQNSFSG